MQKTIFSSILLIISILISSNTFAQVVIKKNKRGDKKVIVKTNSPRYSSNRKLNVKTNRNRIVVTKPQRPKVIVKRPNRLKRGHVWIDGHWKWSNFYNNYIWIDAHWKQIKRGYYWSPGYWEVSVDGFFWVEGFWAR